MHHWQRNNLPYNRKTEVKSKVWLCLPHKGLAPSKPSLILSKQSWQWVVSDYCSERNWSWAGDVAYSLRLRLIWSWVPRSMLVEGRRNRDRQGDYRVGWLLLGIWLRFGGDNTPKWVVSTWCWNCILCWSSLWLLCWFYGNWRC